MQMGELDFLDLRTIVRVIWNRKVVVALLSVGGAVVFYALTYLMTPTYRVTAVLADASDPAGGQALMSALGQLGSLASLAGVAVSSDARTSDEALAVLSSDDFLETFIVSHSLMPVLFAEAWNEATGKWAGAMEAQPTIAKGIRRLRSAITTERDRRTSLIVLSVEWKDPATAEGWCRALIDSVNVEMQRRALERARDYIGYLRKQMDVDATLETRQAIGRLMEAQLKQEMLASVTKDFVFRVVSRGRQPERDRFVRPRRMLFAALGLMLGFGLGVGAAYLHIQKRVGSP